MEEREVKEYLFKKCKAHGIEVRKVIWENRRDAPDLRILGWLWVELKATGKLPRKSQQREFDLMEEHGETVLVVDNKEKVDNLVRKIIEWRNFTLPVNTKKRLHTGNRTKRVTASGVSWVEVRL